MPAKTKSGTITVCRMKAARLSLGWNMRKLSEASGVSLAAIQRAEVGKEVMLSNALRIAHALNYSVEDLWEVPQMRTEEAGE